MMRYKLCLVAFWVIFAQQQLLGEEPTVRVAKDLDKIPSGTKFRLQEVVEGSELPPTTTLITSAPESAVPTIIHAGALAEKFSKNEVFTIAAIVHHNDFRFKQMAEESPLSTSPSKLKSIFAAAIPTEDSSDGKRRIKVGVTMTFRPLKIFDFGEIWREEADCWVLEHRKTVFGFGHP